MKTRTILLAGALLTLLASCNQEEILKGTSTKEGVLQARLEGPLTKTSFDNVEGKLSWTEGDKIAVHFNTGEFGEFVVSPADGTVEVSSSSAHYRDFYAVYPAADAVQAGTLQVTLPSAYDVTDIVASGAMDYAPVPMVALNDENSSFLDFYHVGGLLRIIIEGVPAGTKTIKITTDKDITGTYTVTNLDTFTTAAPAPTITSAGSAGNNVVTFTVSDEGLSTISNITLNLPVPCGTYASVKAEAFGDDTSSSLFSRTFNRKPLTFDRHHGKKLPMMEVNYVFYLSDLSAVTATPAGGTRAFASSFLSYKDNGEEQVKVPFHLELSTDGGATWLDDQSTWPDWVSIDDSQIDYTGAIPGDPQSLRITIEPQVNSKPDVAGDNLRANAPKVDFDLSTLNVATGETVSTTTANCYVIQASGSYKFPVVYGNAIKNGSTNTSAYSRTASAGNQYLTKLVDHKDRELTTPYIPAQLASDNTVLTATIEWTDAPGLIQNVAYIAGDEADLTDDYISFEVPSENITSGNALISVRSNDVIAWSWHIWVTDVDLTDVRAVNGGFSASTVNVGWVDKKEETYIARNCIVRVVQNISDKTSEANVLQSGDNITTLSNSPYYQWGRPHPWHSAASTSTYKKTYPANAMTQVSDRASVGQAIQNPARRYGYSEGTWMAHQYENLWNINTARNNTVKTIYDPSPVGFKVWPVTAFSALENQLRNNTINGTVGYEHTTNGLFFPAYGAMMTNTGIWHHSTSGAWWGSNYATRLVMGDASIWSNAGILMNIRPVVDNL